MIEQFIIKKGSKMENKILNQEVEISTKDPSVKSLSVWGWLVFLIYLLVFLPFVIANMDGYITLPTSAHPEWLKLLYIRVGCIILAVIAGMLMTPITVNTSNTVFLKNIKWLNRACFFLWRSIIITFIIFISMVCSVGELMRFNFLENDFSEGLFIVISSNIVWLYLLGMIAYLASKPSFSRPFAQFLSRWLWKEVK